MTFRCSLSLLPAILLLSVTGGPSARVMAGQVSPGQLAEVAKPVANVDHANAFAALEAQIACFDTLTAKVPDIQQRTAMKALLDGFKDRRDELHKNYNSDSYGDLRWDINVEYQRLVAWFVAPTITVSTAKTEHAAQDTLDLLNPSPANKAEMQAALDVVDRKLQDLEDCASTLSFGPALDAEVLRIQTIKDRRTELTASFTKERWAALVAAMKVDSAGDKYSTPGSQVASKTPAH